MFEGCIASTPRDITTPSGGTHRCDGTNNGANPSSGATSTTQIDQAALQNGFTYDGTYSGSFQDYFITRIGDTAQTSSQFWGVLQNLAFTPAGGCQTEVLTQPGGEDLWAFDAFNKNFFLTIDLDYAVVRPGASVSLTVSGADGNGGNLSPIAGASIAGTGATSDGSGRVTFTAPMNEGCYQYKATRSDSIRSKAFYLTVLNSFGQ